MRVIILENIRSLNNVGAILRTADGAGFDRVVMVGYTPTPPRKEISKTALGAENFVIWEYFTTIEAAIAAYREQGCVIVAIEKNDQSHNLFDFKKTHYDNICLIMGNEIDGVSRVALDASDAVLHLPMLGKKESLNVSVAAGVAMYAFVE